MNFSDFSDFNYKDYCMDILIKKLNEKLNLELSFKVNDEY